MITVSHDRYFLDNVVDRIFELDGNGHTKQYEGGYTDYLTAKQREQGSGSGTAAEKTNKTGRGCRKRDGSRRSKKPKTSSKNWKQHSQKLKFTYKDQREYETIDDDIAALEKSCLPLSVRLRPMRQIL